MAINHLVNFILPRFPRGVNIFLRVCQWTMPRLFVPSVAHFSVEIEGGVAHDSQFWRFVCHEFFIFFRRLRRSGTRFSIPAICVPRIAHFPPEVEGGVAHDSQFRRFVCHELFIFFSTRCSRQRLPGTQIPILPLCVPKLSAARPRDGARLAHKSRFYRFVCQSFPLPGRETAPG